MVTNMFCREVKRVRKDENVMGEIVKDLNGRLLLDGVEDISSRYWMLKKSGKRI